MHMGIPVCERVGIAKKFTYEDPRMHNEVVPIWGLTHTSGGNMTTMQTLLRHLDARLRLM